ncbi:hypothetical protein PLICRDRAFT_39739 [Plicaturopsis crispa FD-325 SS-3]|nr:hypothetical protein PLICRDRAFT_39739 [Plicaturopsis crispa FD-325 SS-3]
MADARTPALLAHVLSQMQANLDFLLREGYIAPDDANAISERLSAVSVDGSNATSRANSVGRRSMPSPAIPVQAPAQMQARAIWGYNEDGHDPADLSFPADALITVVAEVNADWWRGSYNGREALFPSAYVERVAVSMPTASSPANNAPVTARRLPPASTGTKKPYKPFGAALHGTDLPPTSPPPQTQQVQAAPVNSVGLQEDPGQAQKKSKFGKYGNTMAHSAAGGVGFGAGAAIGGGLVRAIF